MVSDMVIYIINAYFLMEIISLVLQYTTKILPKNKKSTFSGTFSGTFCQTFELYVCRRVFEA